MNAYEALLAARKILLEFGHANDGFHFVDSAISEACGGNPELIQEVISHLDAVTPHFCFALWVDGPYWGKDAYGNDAILYRYDKTLSDVTAKFGKAAVRAKQGRTKPDVFHPPDCDWGVDAGLARIREMLENNEQPDSDVYDKMVEGSACRREGCVESRGSSAMAIALQDELDNPNEQTSNEELLELVKKAEFTRREQNNRKAI